MLELFNTVVLFLADKALAGHMAGKDFGDVAMLVSFMLIAGLTFVAICLVELTIAYFRYRRGYEKLEARRQLIAASRRARQEIEETQSRLEAEMLFWADSLPANLD